MQLMSEYMICNSYLNPYTHFTNCPNHISYGNIFLKQDPIQGHVLHLVRYIWYPDYKTTPEALSFMTLTLFKKRSIALLYPSTDVSFLLRSCVFGAGTVHRQCCVQTLHQEV